MKLGFIYLVEEFGIESAADRVVLYLLLLEPLGVRFEDVEILHVCVGHDGREIQCQPSPTDSFAACVGRSHEQDTVGGKGYRFLLLAVAGVEAG